MIAASHDGVTTGFLFYYFRRLHIGATAWNIFAQLGYNPDHQLFPPNDIGKTDVAGFIPMQPGIRNLSIPFSITLVRRHWPLYGNAGEQSIRSIPGPNAVESPSNSWPRS